MTEEPTPLRAAGLTTDLANRRLAEVGPNALPEVAPVPLWRRLLAQFQNPLIYILLFALAIDLAVWLGEGRHGWPLEAIAIAATAPIWSTSS
ncbi:MAG: hypothetical protein FJ206_00565 [Gemmatimonadetes bacterium]|nr:hypothetical protein [Gemmatimonadota bacterium]